MLKRLALIVLVTIFALPATAGTLDDVRARGKLICGVSEGIEGFSLRDANNVWQGFDVDFCKAVAAAILGDPDKVDYLSLSADQRFEALTKGNIDLLSRNSTWTMRRDLALGLDFVGPIYIDGQSFLVPALYGLNSVRQMEGATICVVRGTTSEVNGPNFFSAAGMQVNFTPFADRDEARKAYEAGECDALTGDRSALAGERAQTADPDAHLLLRDVISKEPLSPVVRQDDPQWTDLVRWVLFALINAEELGLTAEQTDRLRQLGAPMVENFDLDPDWYQHVLSSVGTYADMFERHLGENTPLELSRGLNALWTEGGLLYAPPMQ
ncbi:MAG: amino acid ABC transporter substrate-binding protein [Hyphomicrobiaceae bacterium]|nr:amino acid ABC transporter substrate-binding protein [Hyphomicrobiaceae bacterium]MCC0023733.1 amino acid ABC transporter substrate-binding protein [Hyphomicrobiaceae bacterium]